MKLQKSGIFVADVGFLGASPDGLVTNEGGEKCGIIEIKCPYSCRKMSSLLDGCQKLKTLFCEEVNGEVHVKRTHNFYYQVQGAMALAKVEWCDFIVWTPNDMTVERISFSKSFWDSCYTKLKSVYLSCILPEIIYLRLVNDFTNDVILYPFSDINQHHDHEP
jgi:hypothetical protein